MNSGLEGGLSNFNIEVQTGARDVTPEGNFITGTWDTNGTIYQISKRRSIALDVLNPFLGNDSLANAALDFTKRFGPLTMPFCRDEPFRFSIDEWKMARKHLRTVWHVASRRQKRKWPFNIPVDPRDGDHFSFDNGRLTFRTQHLSTFMALEIAAIPIKRFRQCGNFRYGCKSPYFFASDLRERYCSEACAHESKNRAKLKWWNQNRRGKEDGAQETR